MKTRRVLSFNCFSLPYRVGSAVFIACYFAISASSVQAGVITTDFNCGVTVCGSLTVTHDDAVTPFSNPFQITPGDDTSWAISAGMEITATVTPKTSNSGKWAWMQAITDYTSPITFKDKDGDGLTAPWPDTPPGGYTFDNFPPQVFDDDPWYGNNNIGDLTLYDEPKTWTDATMNFESWLVCVIEDVLFPDVTNLIPLVGFTWGFSASKGADGLDPGNVAGDSLDEYFGTTFRGPIVQGGQPSDTFKAGFAKYFFDLDYLDNNNENCSKYHCVSEPSSLMLLLIGYLGFRASSSRARSTKV